MGLWIFLIIVFSCSFFGVLSFANADELSASLPPREVGDTWTFALDYKGSIGLKCDLESTVTGQVLVAGRDCFEFTSVGTGDVYGDNVSGDWSIQFKEYYVKSDFSLAKTMVNQEVVIVHSNGTTATRNQTIQTVYDPAFGLNNGFPCQ
jgi:hypothetical protein